MWTSDPKFSNWLVGLAETHSGAPDVEALAVSFVHFARDVLSAPAGTNSVLKPHSLVLEGSASFGVSDARQSHLPGSSAPPPPRLHRSDPDFLQRPD